MTDKYMEDVNENDETMSRKKKHGCKVHSTGDAMRIMKIIGLLSSYFLSEILRPWVPSVRDTSFHSIDFIFKL